MLELLPPFSKTSIPTLWPEQQAINLGNLLVFRKELEMLALYYGVSHVTLFFQNAHQLPPYFDEIFASSSIHIEPVFSKREEFVWPPMDAEIASWTYGSFKRVHLLHQLTRRPISLSWSSLPLFQANELYREIALLKKSSEIVAVHLKNQKGGPEESNAAMQEWEKLFSSHPRVVFTLLGEDSIDQNILELPNTVRVAQENVSLAVQLAFCSICDAFIGMATGIAAAAILSQTPYVIFKHPLHHVPEMAKELGTSDQFEFAFSKQKLWRKLDSYQNLELALEMLL